MSTPFSLSFFVHSVAFVPAAQQVVDEKYGICILLLYAMYI